jgi:hypothetical protein
MSANDKLFLLGSMRLVRKKGSYAYIEIGSFLGGSLTPFLMDPACRMVLSIDERGRIQPDERGMSYDYSAFTTHSMISELMQHGMPTEKLKTFDGSIHALTDFPPTSFDIAFIDGEHTDEACFRDFLWTFPLMKPDSIVIFHDSTLVYKALKLIMVYLDKSKRPYVLFKKAGLKCRRYLLFGDYVDVEHVEYVGSKEDLRIFLSNAEVSRIENQFRNRVRLRFSPGKLLKLQLPIHIVVDPPKIIRF